MGTGKGAIGPEDYAEPRCVLCEEPYGASPEVKPVPQQRIVEKLDEYMGRRDFEGAERHLKYWLEEAGLGADLRGELLIRNEMVGYYRKTGRKEEALENAAKATDLLKALGFEGTISSGTTYTNAATAHQAFGESGKALELFEKAKEAYENAPRTSPELLGGLYNNMGLTCVSLKRFGEARELYEKALEKMKEVPHGELECAITYLNMANAAEAEHGMEKGEEEIFGLLDKAWDLLEGSDAPKNGYYAFVCEKCAPTFEYYGYFLAAAELNKTAEEIYSRQ